MTNTADRREFIKAAGAVTIAAGAVLHAGVAFGADVKGAAETVFKGGVILTMVDGAQEVQAVAIAGGKVLAAGSEADIMKLANDQTKIIDLHGATLMPSFIDAHGHFMNAPQVVNWANVSGVPAGPVTSIPDIIKAVQEHKDKLKPAAGEWIIGYGYDMTNLSEGRELTRDDLDPHFPDNPIMLIHSSNHGAVLNSVGFAKVGIDASTPTPPAGVILRKPGSNEPAGLLMETAFLPIFAAMPQPTEEQLLETFNEAQQLYARAGVTTCMEGATHSKDLKLLRKAGEQGRFYLDIVSLPLVFEVPAMVKEYFPNFQGGPMDIPKESADAFGTYKNRLKLQGVKIVLDGSNQGKTGFWTKPLLTPGPTGEKNWRGSPTIPPETANKIVAELYSKDIQVFCHCNADAAIDMLIDAHKAAGGNGGKDRRTVVIHSQIMRPDQLDTYVEQAISPSFFTVHTFFWGDVHVENLGEERAFFMSPMASAKAKGIIFSNHNDFSVTPIDPMRMVQSAMARTSRSHKVIGPNERVDAWTALKAITIGAAWQIREEASKGTIEVGKLADLVILNANPLTTETDKILDIAIVETFKEGKSVYKKMA